MGISVPLWAVMLLGQIFGEAILIVTTYLSFLRVGMSHDLMPGLCFYYLSVYYNALRNWDQVSCP